MAAASVILSIVALGMAIAGILLSVVPIAGALFSFLAPIAALAGIVTGGLGLSEAKRDGLPTSTPTAGIVLSVLAFLFSVVIALTCGLCNACLSAGELAPGRGRPSFAPVGDGGMPRPRPSRAPRATSDPPKPPPMVPATGGDDRPDEGQEDDRGGSPPPPFPPPAFEPSESAP